MTAVDIAVRETLTFIESHLGNQGQRILEIGAGQGELAAALTKSGYQVIALDNSEEAVAAAQTRGVDARHADWPHWQDEPYDAIIFTRSLHHMDHLTASLLQARELLVPNGLLLVEDFAFSDLGPWALSWFHHELRILEAAGCLQPQAESFVAEFLNVEDPLEFWSGQHHFHSAGSISTAIRALFPETSLTPAPYFYRYVLTALADDAQGEVLLERFLAQEKLVGQMVDDFLLGRRWTARKTDSQPETP